MRILMVSKACIVGIYQRKLEEMARLPGVDLTVIVPPSWRESSGEVCLERAYQEGYRMLVEPIRFNGDFHLHYFPTVPRHLAEFRPDIVHIDEEPYNLASWHTLRAARRIGARTLIFGWQNILRRYPWPFSAGEAWTLRHIDHAIAGTESVASIWRDKGYRGPLSVIPQFGVDPVMFQPVEKPATDRPLRIGYIGRLVPEKGIDLLIRALRCIRDSNPDFLWELEIIGGGPERHRLEGLAERLGLSDRLTFSGSLKSTQMPERYRQLDLIVVPSRTLPNWKEQFGRVLIEAMACGLPVIGSDSGAIPDVVGEGGLIFPEDDLDALADRLRRLLQDGALRHQLGERGRARIVEKFTHAQVAAQTVDVYRQMLDRPRQE